MTDGALELYLNEAESVKGRWNFFQALLFVFTLVSTIGYGNLTPRTTPGRVFCILFALIGIPLMLLEIGISGKVLAGVFLAICRRTMPFDISKLMPNESSRRAEKVLGKKPDFEKVFVNTCIQFHSTTKGGTSEKISPSLKAMS